jgi:transposase
MGEIFVGLDFARKRMVWCGLWRDGSVAGEGVVASTERGVLALAEEVAGVGGGVPVAVVESMTGTRWLHDLLEGGYGWDVRIADAAKARLLAPLACKTDRIDAAVLASLGRLDLVPEIWLADAKTRSAREVARFRLHLVAHRTMLKNRIHQSLLTHGVAVRVSDLFGVRGRELLERLVLPEPWQRTVSASVWLIDQLNDQIGALEADLRGCDLDSPKAALLRTAPGIGWILGYTIAAEIGPITRFASPKHLVGYTGLCPRVYQSADRDRRGPLAKTGPKWLRWALIEAAIHAAHSTAYRDSYQHTRQRLGKQRGPAIARITIARKLTEAIWYMLTRNQPFAPAGATRGLAP